MLKFVVRAATGAACAVYCATAAAGVMSLAGFEAEDVQSIERDQTVEQVGGQNAALPVISVVEVAHINDEDRTFRALDVRTQLQIVVERMGGLAARFHLTNESLAIETGDVKHAFANFEELQAEVFTTRLVLSNVLDALQPARPGSAGSLSATSAGFDQYQATVAYFDEATGLSHTTLQSVLTELKVLRGELLVLEGGVEAIRSVVFADAKPMPVNFSAVRSEMGFKSPRLVLVASSSVQATVGLVDRVIDAVERALARGEQNQVQLDQLLTEPLAQAIVAPEQRVREHFTAAYRSMAQRRSRAQAGRKTPFVSTNLSLQGSQGVTHPLSTLAELIFMNNSLETSAFSNFLDSASVATTELVDYLDDDNVDGSEVPAEVADTDIETLPSAETTQEEVQRVDEPGSLVLITLGLAFLALMRRFSAKQA